MRLLIAIPCGDTVRYEFAESLANLCKHLSDIGVEYDLKWHEGSLVYMAREELANHAINEAYTHMLWLDTDMVFTPDMFDLLRELKEPFATGCYRARRCPYAFVMKDSQDLGKRVMTLPDKPFEVLGCGFGFVLIETDAPYLPPVPHRGKMNHSGYLVHTAEVMAEIRGTTAEAIADLTYKNACRIFALSED